MQTEVLFVDEELHVQTVEAGVRVPVDVPQIIADTVRAIVAELDGVPAPRALALTLDAAAEDPPGREREPLELREELGCEERGALAGPHGYRSSSAWK